MLIDRRNLFAAGAGLLVPANAVAAPPAAGRFRFKGWRGEEVEAERGFFEVSEDRRDPAARRIRLSYVRFPSTAARPGPPIVYLAGGPGGTATGTATGPRFPIFMALRDVADVIAFDQRGTGLSNHIPRRSVAEGSPPTLTRDALTAAVRRNFVEAWQDWTAAGVAMAGYNTAESADDIDDLRRHIGAERISLWGISYGSHLGLSVLKRHGERVHRVAFASLEGQDQTVKRPGALDLYLGRVEALIASDREVRSAVPDPMGLMRRVHTRLEADPLRLTAPVEGRPVELQVGGFGVQMMAGAMVANPPTLAMLPALYRALDVGETSVLTPFIRQLAGAARVSGMPEAMDLASGITAARLRMVDGEARSAVLGDALNFPMPHLVDAIPGVDLGDDFRAPIRIEHPALLVAGTLDGRTPLEEQAEVASQFERRTQVTVENAGHNVFEAHHDVQALLVRFFRGEDLPETRLALPPPVFRV